MTTRTPPPSPDDSRDDRVSAWLAVAPLDELARARLVRGALTALDADPDRAGRPAASTSRRPLAAGLAVAAVIVVLLVVAAIVLVPGDDGTTPTAVPAPAESVAPGASREAGPTDDAQAVPESATAAEGAVDGGLTLPWLGDLGDVSTPSDLERAVRIALAGTPGARTSTVPECAAAAGRTFGTPVAAGTGRIDGRRATVLVAQQASGATAAVAVRGRTCSRTVSAILG